MPENQAMKKVKRVRAPREEFTRAEKWLRENSLARALLERSHLDQKTLKTMLMYYWSEDATFEELAEGLHIQRPGAWKRWQRGLDAIMRSFYTLELAIYAGVLEAETAELMADDLRDYISLARGEGDLGELQARIERRMVQLAKKAPARRLSRSDELTAWNG